MDIRNIYEDLSIDDKETFDLILRDLEEYGSNSSVEGLHRTISQLKSEINRAHEKIGILKDRKERIEQLSQSLSEKKFQDPSLILILTVLESEIRSLHDQIGDLSPSEKMAKKSKLTALAKELESKRDLSILIQSEIREDSDVEDRISSILGTD